ncbi:zinc finger CCHC domain-containing protein 17-like isoform X1 [Bombus flavifrons]|uniref:zinc finger CCHC domain-containing protein 17-like isoform X1 n=1 Tax=Bombus flavifrons TaxID=103934 RepID=UPI003704230A
MTRCKLNQIFIGEVASVQNYGAFIRIPGCSFQGLIHKSQVSSAHINNVGEVLQKGERIWCKVIYIGDDGKIGLSMKHVNQGNGTDLDPNGIQLQRDVQKKRPIEKHDRRTIHLEAILNTTCMKCGTAGHLSKDCFMSPDGKRYELIPEIEEKQDVIQIQSDISKKDTRHKQKKLKRKKKAKKIKHDALDSDSDEKDVIKKKKKKYSKDRKKKKKKHESSCSDKNSSDSSSSHDVKAHKRKHSESSGKRTKKCKYSKTKYASE